MADDEQHIPTDAELDRLAAMHRELPPPDCGHDHRLEAL